MRPTWGSSNLPGLEENCEMDDNVEDTPNTIGWSSCDLSGSTCGSLDNVQNYMSYSFCSRMFTYGQKQRMRAAALSTTAQRNQLSVLSNLQATGVDIVGPEIECFCPGIIDECGICNGPGASGECGCFALPEGDCDCEGNQFDAIGVCGGTCTLDNDGNGVCDENELYGCTYPLALNYSILATRDDGSCDFNICGLETVFDATTGNCIIDETYCSWQPDSDGDQLIGVSDLLMFLSVFGDTDLDQDGIFDSNDDCVGEYDECGVCNGSGPSIPIIESIEILFDSLYAEQLDEWLVYEYADTTFSFTCYEWSCGDPLEYQGYDYETVQIGEQCWFAENLRAENYKNGDVIPKTPNAAEWYWATYGATVVYGEGTSSNCGHTSPDGDACDDVWSLDEYGRLYNWHAAEDSRSICPNGWHISTDEEWMNLEMALGMSEADAHATGGLRGTDQGTQIKTTYGWENESNGSNSSGFSALPGGKRDGGDANFINAGGASYWWSPSEESSQSWVRYLIGFCDSGCQGSVAPYNFPRINRFQQEELNSGYSIRCIKD